MRVTSLISGPFQLGIWWADRVPGFKLMRFSVASVRPSRKPSLVLRTQFAVWLHFLFSFSSFADDVSPLKFPVLLLFLLVPSLGYFRNLCSTDLCLPLGRPGLSGKFHSVRRHVRLLSSSSLAPVSEVSPVLLEYHPWLWGTLPFHLESPTYLLYCCPGYLDTYPCLSESFL